MTGGEIAILILVLFLALFSIGTMGISLYLLSQIKKQKEPKVDITPIKDVVDLKIGQIASENKHFASYMGEKISMLEKAMKELNEQNNKNYVDMMEKFNASINQMSKQTREENEKAIENLNKKFDEFSKNMTEKYNQIDTNVGKALSELRRENSEKLEGIQKVVDEKLQKTIDERLKESFDNVVSQIGNVNKAIGEIKGIATDVGSLKNVLTNVKTKGIAGEIILGGIIGEILTKEQYGENVVTKNGSRDPVEFAVKMPSSDGEFIYLPIDSKFPLESYYKIKDAIDEGNKDALELARKELRAKILTFAKDISGKYIDPPNTTDFAIMFLPIEGLYIEAIELGLLEECQRKYSVNIAGPTTLAALLNALKQGFKSLAIQKKSADVFKLLEAVKTEFETFADALTKTKKHIEQADADLANLIGTRTNVMTRKLKTVDVISGDEAKEILGIE